MQAGNEQRQKLCPIYWGLALVTICLYLPVIHHDFVNYDDQQYVTDNPRVQAGLTWRGLVWAFGFYAGNWHPLAWLSHMLDCQIFGSWAGGHHLTNVLLHTGSTLLLFAILNRTTKTLWRSAAVAALFAWHPLHVESVAWIAERKDVLCGFFWMATCFFYVRYAEQRSAARYLLALGTFVLGLMSKPMAVTLPFVLLLLDFWPLGRWQPGASGMRSLKVLLLEKIPFFVLAAGACFLTLRAQQIAIVSTAGLTIPQRMAHALVAYSHYILAMFVPVHLAVYYPYQIHAALYIVFGSALVLGAITTFVIINSRSRPYLIAGWLWYLGTLVPVIGLVQVGDQAWADRYTYLPLIGLFLMVVWLAGELIKNRAVIQTTATVIFVGLLALTWQQLACWKNTRTLFEHANEVTHHNYLAITMLGSILASEHKYDEAISYYEKALSYEPTFPEAHFFLGAALDEQGNLADAIAQYQQALWFKPTQEQTHIFMGMALAKQKKYHEAMAHYEAALKINPDSAVAENNLARVFHTLGKLDEAISHYQSALALNPKLALAHNNLGVLLIQKGQSAEGTAHLREALRLEPNNAETQFNLALALNQQKRWDEAASLFSKTIGDHPNDANAHYEFAVALEHLKRTREAMSEYASALLIQPDLPKALDGLAWVLSTDPDPNSRNGAEAVKMAKRACDLTANKDPEKLRTLAATYAETGSFAEAINILQTAIKLAEEDNHPEFADQCKAMLQRFQRSEPWRE